MKKVTAPRECDRCGCEIPKEAVYYTVMKDKLKKHLCERCGDLLLASLCQQPVKESDD